jgi:hypothetical protein
LYPNGVVDTKALIPEEEDEDDYLNTTNNAGGKLTNIKNIEKEGITNEEGEHAMETNETNDTNETSKKHDVDMEDENEDDSFTTSGDIEDCPFAKRPTTIRHHICYDDDSTPPPLSVRRTRQRDWYLEHPVR